LTGRTGSITRRDQTEMVQVPRQTLEEFQRVLDDSLNRLRRLEQRLDKVGVQ